MRRGFLCGDDRLTGKNYDHRRQRIRKRPGWLTPIAQEPHRKKVREKPAARRVSNNGCLPLSLPEYLQLVDWTGRQVSRGKRGVISKDVPSMIERLGSTAEIWMRFVRTFSARRHVQSVTPINQQAVNGF